MKILNIISDTWFIQNALGLTSIPTSFAYFNERLPWLLNHSVVGKCNLNDDWPVIAQSTNFKIRKCGEWFQIVFAKNVFNSHCLFIILYVSFVDLTVEDNYFLLTWFLLSLIVYRYHDKEWCSVFVIMTVRPWISTLQIFMRFEFMKTVKEPKLKNKAPLFLRLKRIIINYTY